MCPNCRTMVARPPHGSGAATASPRPQQPPVYGVPQAPYGQPGYPQPQYTQPTYQQPPVYGAPGNPYGQHSYSQQPPVYQQSPMSPPPGYNTYYPSYAPPVSTRTPQQLLSQLSDRLKISGIIWVVIAAIQIILGIECSGWWLLTVGALNIISAVKDIRRSSEILSDPTGIIGEHESVTGPTITLVYNIGVAIIGLSESNFVFTPISLLCLVGVIGSIYYFTAIRGLIMKNIHQFALLEQYYRNNN